MPHDLPAHLEDQLLADFPETAPGTLRNIQRWLSGELPLVPIQSLRQFLDSAPTELIHESFWQDIPFGTGGVRGTVGFGPNRINRTVAALTTQAHCDFMDSLLTSAAANSERSVVVANDVRRFIDIAGHFKALPDNPHHADNEDYGVSSRSLAYLCAEVYAGNGFHVYMIGPDERDALLTTPELSFLIRYLNACGGVNLSASHNHPDDNGLKVYDENGGQYLPPRDEDLTTLATKVTTARIMPFSQARAKDIISDIPVEALAAYRDLYRSRARERRLDSASRTSVVFTPLGGCGERTVSQVLEDLGYRVIIPQRDRPDGTFSSIPLLAPNPEVAEATIPAKEVAEDMQVSLVLAADPDADRLGVEVFHADEWRHLTGNQIGTILAYYLLLDDAGPRLKGAVYETLVTTRAVQGISKRAQSQYLEDNLLVGFKYIGEAMQRYEQTIGLRSGDEVVAFAVEESHGFLDTPHLRDKDALAGALYLAKLHERLQDQGRSLVDYLSSVYSDIGEYGDRGRSIAIAGSVGLRAIADLMATLRHKTPSTLGGVPIKHVSDYWKEEVYGSAIRSETERAARNVVVFHFDGGRMTLRPSGTEPKLKLYVQTTEGRPGAGAQAYADEISDGLYKDILRLLGYELEASITSLPDVVWLDSKLELANMVLPRLRDELANPEVDERLLARWLRENIERLVPGQSAVEITLPALWRCLDTSSEVERARLERVLGAAGA